MLVVILIESFLKKPRVRVVDAAKEAGSIIGFNEKAVREYRKQFYKNKGDERRQGKYERICVYRDDKVSQ